MLHISLQVEDILDEFLHLYLIPTVYREERSSDAWSTWTREATRTRGAEEKIHTRGHVYAHPLAHHGNAAG